MEYSKRNEITKEIRCVLYLIIISVVCSSNCLAQGIKVVKVEEINSGTDAFNAPNGKDGMPCGLVKIKSTFTDLSFHGQIVGDVDNKTNEYFVYMEKGTTQLIVSRPNVLPVVIHFPDFGIDNITSKATYSVLIKNVKLDSQKNIVSIDVKPRFANIFINDIPISSEINDNGHYQILLPNGSHVCRFVAEGYSSYVQGINVGKDNPNLSVELESQLSDLEILCQTPLSFIYINDSLIGKGSWNGKMPSGSYKIDIRKDGYVPYSQNVVLNKKETRSILVPELKRKKGIIIVETNPIKFHNAYIDGFKIEHFPLEIEIGNHYLLLQAYGCDTIRSNINVVDDKDNHFTYDLSAKNRYYEKAYQGDIESLMALADNKIDFGKTNSDLQEGLFWLSMITSKMESINTTFLSGIFYENYDEIMDFEKCIGEVTYSGYPNYDVLFRLFTNSKVNDYASALVFIDKCGSLEKEFDSGFCYWVGDAYMKTNKKKDALPWFKKCIERYDGRGDLIGSAKKIIKEIENNFK